MQITHQLKHNVGLNKSVKPFLYFEMVPFMLHVKTDTFNLYSSWLCIVNRQPMGYNTQMLYDKFLYDDY